MHDSIMPHGPFALPPSIRVVERGWLNSNQVVCLAPAGNVVIDSGYGRDTAATLAGLRDPDVLGSQGVARLINTHCHADHMGGNAALARAYDCQVTIPVGEAAHVRPWDAQALWLAFADQEAEPFDFIDTLSPGATFFAGGLEWEALPAPGHDMDALLFLNRDSRVLISGDALWENGLGAILPAPHPNPRILAALGTLKTIEQLDPRVVIPGHGPPFLNVEGAIERARSRLRAFAADPVKNARHVVKVMLVFALLDKGGLPEAELAAYLARVPAYREMNEAFIHLNFDDLARQTLADLKRSQAVVVEAGWIRATMRA